MDTPRFFCTIVLLCLAASVAIGKSCSKKHGQKCLDVCTGDFNITVTASGCKGQKCCQASGDECPAGSGKTATTKCYKNCPRKGWQEKTGNYWCGGLKKKCCERDGDTLCPSGDTFMCSSKCHKAPGWKRNTDANFFCSNGGHTCCTVAGPKCPSDGVCKKSCKSGFVKYAGDNYYCDNLNTCCKKDEAADNTKGIIDNDSINGQSNFANNDDDDEEVERAPELDATSCKMRYGKTHSACLKERGTLLELTRKERNAILDLHNKLRAEEPATDMMKLEWDDEVAMIAGKWAANCEFKHDENYNRNIPNGYQLGQNLAFSTANYNKFPERIMAWYNEIDYFTYDGTNDRSLVGHYTQLVWSSSHVIGCAVAKCPAGTVFYRDTLHYACNYGPPGNYNFSRPYNKGKRGADCGDSFEIIDGKKICKFQQKRRKQLG